MNAINRGVPVSSLSDGQAIYQNFKDLARQITGLLSRADTKEEEDSQQSSSLLSAFFNKK
jgi:hypothetical protein